jgi:hypothetical protein
MRGSSYFDSTINMHVSDAKSAWRDTMNTRYDANSGVYAAPIGGGQGMRGIKMWMILAVGAVAVWYFFFKS